MNIVLANAEEIKENGTKNLNSSCPRGDNIVFISLNLTGDKICQKVHPHLVRIRRKNPCYLQGRCGKSIIEHAHKNVRSVWFR